MNRKHSMYVDSSPSRPPATAYSHSLTSGLSGLPNRNNQNISNRNGSGGSKKMSSSSMYFDSSNFATLSSSSLKRNFSEGENLRKNSTNHTSNNKMTSSNNPNGDNVQQEWDQVRLNLFLMNLITFVFILLSSLNNLPQ